MAATDAHKKGNQNKADQLGMSYGTACDRLRKKILFSKVQTAGLDICFKCGSKIDSIEVFSVEHKVSWLHVSTELFWDLENIAFSHRSCNTVDNPRPRGKAFRGKRDSNKIKTDQLALVPT